MLLSPLHSPSVSGKVSIPRNQVLVLTSYLTAKLYFARNITKKAQDEWGYGKDVMSMYPDWNKDLEVAPIVPVKTNIRPFNDFKKSPEEVVDTVDSQGGARFKTAYVSNIRAAKNVTKCESCGEHKIEVLTDASTLICLPCFHSGKGFVKGQINGATDIPVGATGWPSAGKLKPLRSQQADRKSSPSEEGDRPPPPALGNRSVSRRRQHSPEDKRGRKASRTESRHNPSSNIPQAPAEGNAGGPINSDAPVLEDNVDSLEEEDNPKSVPTSPTSQALAAFEQLNVTSNTESA